MAYHSREVRVHYHGGKAGCHGNWSSKLRAHILNYKQEAESKVEEWVQVFELSKPTPRDMPHPQ